MSEDFGCVEGSRFILRVTLVHVPKDHLAIGGDDIGVFAFGVFDCIRVRRMDGRLIYANREQRDGSD